MSRVYAYCITLLGLNKGSDPTTGAGALWLALTLADAADGGGYVGSTPIRQVINNWKANGILSSSIGQTFAGILEAAANRNGQ